VQVLPELGEPELGFALQSSLDNAMADEIGRSDLKLTRSGMNNNQD
jgi:hypothetical protein